MLRLNCVIVHCSAALLATLAACTTSATTDKPTAISWGDAVASLQIGLGVIPSTRPKPLPNQYELCFRNISGTSIWLIRPPDELMDDQLIPQDQADPILSILTLRFRTDSGLRAFCINRPQKPEVVELKPGQIIIVKMNLSVDLQLHPGLNRLAFSVDYGNNDPANRAWTGIIRSPEFETVFSQ